MYSQCPECLTRFRVTATALRAAHGTVRCGRCGSAFDALPRLTDTLFDDPDPATPHAGAPATSLVPGLLSATDERLPAGDDGTIITEFHFSADDLEQVFVDAQDWQRQFGDGAPTAPGRAAESAEARRTVAGPARDATTPVVPADVFVHEPEAVEDITLEGERIVIENFADLDDDLRGIGALDEPYDGRPDAEPLAEAVGGGRQSALVDLDSTDQFEALRHVPESQYPGLEGAAPTRTTAPGAGAGAPASTLPGVVDAVAASAALGAGPGDVIAVPATNATTATTTTTATTATTATTESAAAPSQPAAPIVPLRLRDRSSAFEDALDDADDDTRRGSGAAVAWGIGALLLVLALVAQFVHQHRQEVARDATLGPVVREVYARLGRPLEPNWDLGAFELRQWGAGSAPTSQAGVMTVRASLRNGAGFPQPLPLLRLELEDRYGGIVARRDFAAAEYLKDPAQAGRQLGAGAQIEAELVLVDVEADAVGYRLDVCLRDERRGVRCALSAIDGNASR